MPRTKIKNKKPKINSENVKPTKMKLKEETVKCFFEVVENEKKLNDDKLEAEWKQSLLKLEYGLREILIKFPCSDDGKTMAQLNLVKVGELCFDTMFNNTLTNSTRTGFSRLNNNIHTTVSRTPSTVNRKKTTIRARSLSRSKLQQPAQSSLNSLNTPLQKTSSLISLGIITPKIKPNTPHMVLRYPKQGEMVLSMQGSPLMVNGVSSDIVANVNIPLQGGQTLTVLPQRGLRNSLIPYLDPGIQQQIETLRDNLNRICARPTYS